jgi:ribosomal protein L29
MDTTKINSALETLRELTPEEIRERLQSLETESKTLRGLLRTRLLAADSPHCKTLSVVKRSVQ